MNTASIAATLNIREGEQYPTLILFLHSLFAGFATVFVYTAAISLFLAEFDAQLLPVTYIAAAIIIVLVGYTFTYLQRRILSYWLRSYVSTLFKERN